MSKRINSELILLDRISSELIENKGVLSSEKIKIIINESHIIEWKNFIRMHWGTLEFSEDETFVRSTKLKINYKNIEDFLLKTKYQYCKLTNIYQYHMLKNNENYNMFDLYKDKIEKFSLEHKYFVRLIYNEDKKYIVRIGKYILGNENVLIDSIPHNNKKYNILTFIRRYNDLFKENLDKTISLNKIVLSKYFTLPAKNIHIEKIDTEIITCKQFAELIHNFKGKKIIFVDGDQGVRHITEGMTKLENIFICVVQRKGTNCTEINSNLYDNVKIINTYTRTKDAADNLILLLCVRVHDTCDINVELTIATEDKGYSKEYLCMIKEEGRYMEFLRNIIEIKEYIGEDAEFIAQ